MKNQIVRIAVMVAAVFGILIFEVIASRMVVKKLFFTPKTEVTSHSKEGKSPVGEFYMIGDLIINPAESGGRRHLMVSLGLEYHDSLVEEELKRRDPQLRDNLITLLAGQEISVLSDIRYREKIRVSLLKAVNYYLEEGEVEKLYFVKYVFQ